MTAGILGLSTRGRQESLTPEVSSWAIPADGNLREQTCDKISGPVGSYELISSFTGEHGQRNLLRGRQLS